ncbi:hypothetical protein NEOKW01_1528 [Nematocida sp. AWRm80]|nr:hypothetical protein NEOKW01_1528 [Nematocida sp. AWRm80]
MIQLTRTEKKLFNDLLVYNRSIGGTTTLRVAGGWVRDKIMNVPCHDIDIVVDKGSGSVFAKGFLEYFQNEDRIAREKGARKKRTLFGFYVIPYNHEKAKHLETASMNYMDYSIDFVALRTEEYTDSRIPRIRVGTPLEDALRRDLTINSLFYNICTREIEDLTGKGIEDINNKIIRTPLNPRETFLDDPLRILRVFRFASRLGFSVTSDILEVLKEDLIVQRLEKIVSRERIGQEIKKTFACSKYYIGLCYMEQLKILRIPFRTLKINSQKVTMYVSAQQKAIENPKHPLYHVSQDQRWIVNLFSVMQCGLKKERYSLKTSMVYRTIITDLRWTKADKASIEHVISSILTISSIVSQMPTATHTQEYKLGLIAIVRTAKTDWRLVLSIYDLIQITEQCTNTSQLSNIDIAQVYSLIIAHQYTDAYLAKCPFTYNEISNMFPNGIEPNKNLAIQEQLASMSVLFRDLSKADLLKKIDLPETKSK